MRLLCQRVMNTVKVLTLVLVWRCHIVFNVLRTVIEREHMTMATSYDEWQEEKKREQLTNGSWQYRSWDSRLQETHRIRDLPPNAGESVDTLLMQCFGTGPCWIATWELEMWWREAFGHSGYVPAMKKLGFVSKVRRVQGRTIRTWERVSPRVPPLPY